MKLTLDQARELYPLLSFKRVNIHGKYRVIGRDRKGRIRVNKAWTWKPEEEKWLVTTLSYSCASPPKHSSWHIDVTKTTELGELSEREQEAYCMKYLGKAFTKALNTHQDVESRNWGVDLALFSEYKYVTEILDELGIAFRTTEQADGVEEEIMELWRCRVEPDTGAGRAVLLYPA